MESVKLLLDTDIGNDIDDMYALGYLLARPDAELLGITTVTGFPDVRAKMAEMMCRLAGREVPVHVGCELPLLIPSRQPDINADQVRQLEFYPHAPSFPAHTAVEFLRQTIEAHPGEITLCAVGPLTNVGLLFALYPHVAELLKALVVMGGRFGDHTDGDKWGPAEWNIYCDPYAAAAVFSARVPEIRVVGIEITSWLHWDAKAVGASLRRCPWLRPAADAAEKWGTVWFHDPATVATVFDPDNVRWERGTITVETDGATGKTRFAPAAGGNCLVATKLDPKAFASHYCKTLGIAEF